MSKIKFRKNIVIPVIDKHGKVIFQPNLVQNAIIYNKNKNEHKPYTTYAKAASMGNNNFILPKLLSNTFPEDDRSLRMSHAYHKQVIEQGQCIKLK